MSIVGYILGLGDRHPSNLLIAQQTGKVIHIDFGDCFEVANNRKKLPELVPFRLTRMLINTMQIAAIDGSFKLTCQQVLRNLRLNKDSLLSMLEAFVQDPLIGWRLIESKNVEEVESNVLNQKALKAIDRIQQKLTGNDFEGEETLTVEEQVKKLIEQATDKINLCQAYQGWCPFW